MITQSYLSACSEFPNDNPALHLGVIWVCRDVTGGVEPERVIDPAIITMERTDFEAVETESEPIIIVEDLEPLGIEASVEGAIDEIPPQSEEIPPTIASAEPSTLPIAPAISEVVLTAAANDVEEDQEEDEVIVTAPLPVFEEIPAASVLEDPKETTALPPASDDPFTILVCTLADVAIGAGSPHIASMLPGLLFDARLPDVIDGATEAVLRNGGVMMDGNEIAPAFVATTRAWREILRGTSDDFTACGAAMLDEWASDLLARLLDAKAKEPTLRQELRSRGVAAFGIAA